MITIDDKNYFSRYTPSDKKFFYMMKRTDLIIKREHTSEEIDLIMKEYSEKWDADSRLREVEDVLEDHPELYKQLSTMKKQYEYDLLKYHKDEDVKSAYLELEKYLGENQWAQEKLFGLDVINIQNQE